MFRVQKNTSVSRCFIHFWTSTSWILARDLSITKKYQKEFSALFKHDLSEIDKAAEKFIETVEFYQKFLDSGPTAVLMELKMWKKYLIRKGDIKPNNSLKALDDCPEENFPNINMLLRILATLPVSTSTAERTFSSLKRIKTIQRNMIKEVSSSCSI